MRFPRFRRWVLVAASAGAAVLAALFFLADCENATDREVLARIKNSGGDWFSAQELVHGDWDTVCRIDEYSQTSNRLSAYLPGLSLKSSRKMSYVPEDRLFGENEAGIAFVDTRNRKVLVVALPYKEISRIEGERCLERASAHLRLVRVQALNGAYWSLVFAKSPETGRRQ